MVYNREVFARAARGYDAGPLQFILGFDEETIAARHAAESTALTCDPRIPANCIGYVSDLTSRQSAVHIVKDRILMLSRFVEFAG